VNSPNILLILTDEERYPPPYETAEIGAFRRNQLPAREALRGTGLEFHRHYVGSTACAPSRATLFTGHYPSLHGVSQTDGLAKRGIDPALRWLDPDTVPTLGDWFRAGGYRTHYRGKWHISAADLVVPGLDGRLMASDDQGSVIPEAVAAYRRADRLEGFGFSGWIGREPHGPAKADCGAVRDPVFAEQVIDLFGELAATRRDGPWLAVASFINPHDIVFGSFGWEGVLGFDPPDDTVPEIPEPPSHGDTFAGRPSCHEEYRAVWPRMLFEQPADMAYRRLYYYLQKLVDRAIDRVLDALHASGLAGDTVVVFTSDHGDLLGAHGGLLQKWYNAYDETIRVPLVVSGPGVIAREGGISTPTSHVDLLPTLLGLAGIDIERAAAGVAERHVEVHPLVGRDLSGLITGAVTPDALDAPLYFMTEDDISRGSSQRGLVSGEPYEAVSFPSRVESVIATLPTGPGGAGELWKCNSYYQRLDDWKASHGLPTPDLEIPPAEPQFELHNLTTDREERTNRAGDAPETRSRLLSLLERERETKRRLPAHRNPAG
jgi:arylsulfatase A-like enzyme